MTEPLTDAVRRLKKLQQDVERLKASQDQEGEPRLFVKAQESALAADIIDVKEEDLLQLETVEATDNIEYRLEAINSGIWAGDVPQSAGYSAEAYGDNYGSPTEPEPSDRGWGTVSYAAPAAYGIADYGDDYGDQ